MKKICLLLFLCLFNLGSAKSQDLLPPVNYTQINLELDKISAKLNSGKVSAKETSDYLQNINTIQDAVSRSRAKAATDLDAVQKKLNALGPAPENGAKETPAIAKQRREFNQKADNCKALITQADLAKTKIEELNGLILNIRNQELLNNILAKQSSIFHPQEFWSSLVSFATFVYELAKSPLSWYRGLSATDQTLINNNILYVLLTMTVSLLIAVYLSRYLKKWFGYKKSIENPDYSQKVRAALWMFVARGLIPAAIIGAFLIWLKNNSVINTGSFGVFLKTTAVYLLYYYLSKAVVRVIFTPHSPKWRIFEVCDEKALSISSALIFSIAAVSIVSYFQSLANQTDNNSDIIYALKIFANAVKAFCIILVANRFLYNNSSLSDDELNNENDEVGELSTSSKISLAITFFMTAAFSVSLFGYIRLSEFIVNRFIISALIIGVFYIFDKLIRVMFHQILLFKFWIRTFRINRRRLVKTEFWFGLLLTPFLFVLACLILLAVWGVSVDILINNVKNFLVGFNIGGVRISISSISLGLISFFVTTALFKMLKNSFLTGNLSKIDMDDGIRNSLVSAIGFLGFIFSGLLAIAVMGGSLSSIAIIAGALSFGAGMGLQNMVSNLVAGMTILFERPIKVGDWVIINGEEGIVKQINMRSTELETWSKANVIIPNSDILSKSLTNLTYSNRMGRAEIVVGVGYDSDIELVKKTLLEIAADTPDVMKNPAPNVAFTALADSSLNFQLNAYTANVSNKAGISNFIREEIIKRFKKLNIEIPFPQQVVYVRENTPADGKETEKSQLKSDH